MTDGIMFGDEIDRLSKKIERLQSDLARTESFAASSIVLTITLIREMLLMRQLPKDRATELVTTAIHTLRRMYHVGEVNPFEGDTIDFDKLGAALRGTEHEAGAERLLTELLAALGSSKP